MKIQALETNDNIIYGIATTEGFMYEGMWFCNEKSAKDALLQLANETCHNIENKYTNRVNTEGKHTQGRWHKADKELYNLAKEVCNEFKQEHEQEEYINNFLKDNGLTLTQFNQMKQLLVS